MVLVSVGVGGHSAVEPVAGNSLQSPVDPTLASCTPCLTSTLLGDHEDKDDDKDIGKLVGGTRPTAVATPSPPHNTQKIHFLDHFPL